ncbi:MAG: hypothetical protein JRJ14_10170 [Deltaproteobacteria bacterium]|jgi:hypothetical protein|nr:hypothetical protein [Deltaproteobacteria bacterium]
MSNNVKKKLQYDVLFSCLDVLSRANATVSGSDPKLASDISDAIESLSCALQGAEKPGNDLQEYIKRKTASKYVNECDDVIVDVLTNEILYKYSGKNNNGT